VPDRIALCDTHAWRERRSEPCSRYQHGLRRTFACVDCPAEKEEVYALKQRIVDGTEVRV